MSYLLNDDERWASHKRTAAPDSSGVVTTAEIKAHCRVEHSDDDTLIAAMCRAAEKRLEDMFGLAFLTQTWRVTYDAWPCAIRLPRTPAASVTSITYVDQNGDTQTLAADQYTVDTDSEPARVWRAYGVAWPTVRHDPGTIKATYTCGFGNAAAVPADIKQAIMILAGHWYENREQTMTGTIIAEIPYGAESIMASYGRSWL